MPGGSVERSAFGVLDARIEVERGFFCAACIIDALLARKRVNVRIKKIEIAGDRAEFRWSGIPPNGSSEVIFASSSADFNMRSSPLDEKSLE